MVRVSFLIKMNIIQDMFWHTRLPLGPFERKYAKTSNEITFGSLFLTTNWLVPLAPTVILPVDGLITKMPLLPVGRSIPYTIVSDTGPRARTATTSVPVYMAKLIITLL